MNRIVMILIKVMFVVYNLENDRQNIVKLIANNKKT